MKTNITSKILTGALIAALSSTSLSAELIAKKSDEAVQLPTFYVYASDTNLSEKSLVTVDTDWKFKKSLDFQSDPKTTTILTPGNKTEDIQVPAIRTLLINADIAGT